MPTKTSFSIICSDGEVNRLTEVRGLAYIIQMVIGNGTIVKRRLCKTFIVVTAWLPHKCI